MCIRDRHRPRTLPRSLSADRELPSRGRTAPSNLSCITQLSALGPRSRGFFIRPRAFHLFDTHVSVARLLTNSLAENQGQNSSQWSDRTYETNGKGLNMQATLYTLPLLAAALISAIVAVLAWQRRPCLLYTSPSPRD